MYIGVFTVTKEKSEKLITANIMKWLKANGAECYKVHGGMFQRKGEPDITGSIFYKNTWIHFKLEVKTKKGRATALQKSRLKSWAKHDKAAGIVRSVADVAECFDLYIRRKSGLTSQLVYGTIAVGETMP